MTRGGPGHGSKKQPNADFAHLGNLSLEGLEDFFFVVGGFGSFFGFFPSVPIVTPKIPGVVIIKGPLTARKKIYMSRGS